MGKTKPSVREVSVPTRLLCVCLAVFRSCDLTNEISIAFAGQQSRSRTQSGEQWFPFSICGSSDCEGFCFRELEPIGPFGWTPLFGVC